ncbi:MAG: HD domain-containing protein [Lactobacillales bacterium]|jgi:uncharacterized protein|nr:HD domain-containing protein [Lactobacillales bacterium]
MKQERWNEDAEYLAIVDDLINHDIVQQLEEFKQHRYSNRLEHSLNVSYTAYKIAKKRKWDYTSTARGALLHDLFHYEMQEEWKKDLKKESKSHAWTHPKVALLNAKQVTELNHKEEDIILKHMWGSSTLLRPPRYKEAWLVSFVDKYWAIRESSYIFQQNMKRRKNTVKKKFSNKKPLK